MSCFQLVDAKRDYLVPVFGTTPMDYALFLHQEQPTLYLLIRIEGDLYIEILDPITDETASIRPTIIAITVLLAFYDREPAMTSRFCAIDGPIMDDEWAVYEQDPTAILTEVMLT